MDDVQLLAAVLFFICSIAAASVIQWGVSKIKLYKPPVSILWFIFGILICLLELCVIPKHRIYANGHEESEIAVSPDSALGLISIGIAEASRMPHNALYYIVLPILLYDATQMVNWHHFKKNIKTGLMLAVSGIVLQVFVLGALMQWSFSGNGGTVADAASMRHDRVVSSSFLTKSDAVGVNGLLAFDPLFNDDDAKFFPPRMTSPLLRDSYNFTDTDFPQSNVDTGGGELSFANSCMIAAAVGATDPIAVLGVLESLDAPAHLVSLFDCESLINDGTAIFMFSFFKSLSRGGTVSWGHAINEFLRLLCGGPIVGLVSAAILYRCIKHFRFHPFDVTLLVVAVSYLVFFVAEIYLLTSAPLAIVVYGLYFKAYAKAAFDSDTSRVHHTFVRGLATAMTGLVFIVSGIACMRITWDTLTGSMNLEIPNDYPPLKVVDEEPYPLVMAQFGMGIGPNKSSTAMRDLWHVPVFYLLCNLARGLMILLFSPLIKTDLGSFSWKEGVLLWWGGLRGGVCLILALLIEQDEDIPERLASKAALYCASAVFLILTINGTTFEFLFRWLKPYKGNPFKEVYLLNVLKFIDEEYEHEAALLESHWLYRDTDILSFSKLLVPTLGDSVMHEMKGLQIPPVHVKTVLDAIDMRNLAGSRDLLVSVDNSRNTSPSYRPNAHEESSHPRDHASDGIVVNGCLSMDVEAPSGGQETGHDAAARIQNLKSSNRVDLDLVKTVEKLKLVGNYDTEDGRNSEDQDDLPELIAKPQSHVVECGAANDPYSNGVEDDSGTVCQPSRQASLYEVKVSVWSQPQTESIPTTNARKSVRWGAEPPIDPGNKSGNTACANQNANLLPLRVYQTRASNQVYRIRSEPYSGSLDVANVSKPSLAEEPPVGPKKPPSAALTSIQTCNSEVPAAQSRENEWASHFLYRRDPDFVPRTMSVPNNVGAADKTRRIAQPAGARAKPRPSRAPREVRPWHREGEVVTMVVNSMRHLFRRMYEQNFISGTSFVAFMSSNDMVNDYAIAEDRADKFRATWSMVENRNILDEAVDGKRPSLPLNIRSRLREKCPTCTREARELRMKKAKQIIEHVTPFDLEWLLMCGRLRLMSRWKSSILRKIARRCLCQSLPHADQQSVDESWTLERSSTKWAKAWQRFLVWMWALVGPRQIFPALDDLQTLCAYVDVHEEMLVRGDRGLRFILGSKLLSSYTIRTERGKYAVNRLQDFYPESFPYAIICHGAIFLLNLKIQLVEEYHERGLLMTTDCESILEVLKRQIVCVTKYHPNFLFS